MSELFESLLFQRALLAALIIGFTNGFVSVFVVLHRSPLKLGALSHAIFPGIALVVVLFGISTTGVYLGALLAAAAVGLGAIYLARRSALSEETVLAVLFTGAFAAGVFVITNYQGGDALEHWLLGNIIGLSDSDLWMSFLVGTVAVGVIAFFRRPIVVNLFEPDVAATLGVRTGLLNYGMFALLILVLVTTLQAVGTVLAIGLIVTPAAIVRQLTNSVRMMFFWSGAVGALGAVSGFVLAFVFDQPPGASMVLTLSVLFLLAVVIRRFREHVGSRGVHAHD